MKSKASEGLVVKTFFGVLFCVMVAADTYLLASGGFISCFNFGGRWAVAYVVDWYIHAIFIGAWVGYKETSWIIGGLVTVSLTLFGSLLTIGYIFLQFYKLSPEEASKDPLYFVLVRKEKRGPISAPSITVAKVIFSTLGFLMLGALIYTVIVDILSLAQPFVLCFLPIMVDLYIHVLIFSVWVAYKESSWINAFFWIISLICFRSIAACVYIVRELFYLSPQQPISLILFNNRNRDLQASDPLLMTHPNV